LKIISPGWAHLPAARFRFDRPGRSPGPARHLVPGGRAHRVESTRRQEPARSTTWVGPPYPCSGRHRGSRSPLRFLHPTIRLCSLLLFSTLATALPATVITDEPPPSCRTGPKGAPRHRAPPAPRACPQHRLAKLGNGIPPPSSSSMSTSPMTAFSDCSPTLPTPQRVPCRQGAPPRPLLWLPRPLLRPLTGVSSSSARAPPQKSLPR
jgi:hypothetical protein